MRHGRRDANHGEIRRALVDVCGKDSVGDLADLGDGWPDLVAGFRGVTYFFEVKRDAKAKLRPRQIERMRAWRGGPWIRVDSKADALRALGCVVQSAA